MAADTAAKRLSAMNLMMPWRGNAVIPSGTVDSAERATVLLLYSGIPGESPVAVAKPPQMLLMGVG